MLVFSIVLDVNVLELGEIFPVLAEHLPDHLLYLRQRQNGGGKGIIGYGMEHHSGIAGEGGFDGHFFNGHTDIVQSGTLRG